MLIKEELVHYLTRGHIHVSRQDYLFFTNLEKFSQNKSVTTGQNKLLNKLLDKYKRQLAKENLYAEELKKLNWNFDLIETKVEFQQPRLYIENDLLVLKTPYNKKLINEINRSKSEGEFFTWDKVNKAYKCRATNHALKRIIFIIEDIFEDTVYCDSIRALLNEANEYANYIWKPTLVESNGNLYIGALNESLYEHIKDIDLKSDAKTLFELSKFGIVAESKLLDNDEKQFAINFNVEVDSDKIHEMALWLKNLGIHTVSNGFSNVTSNKLYKSLQGILMSEGIKLVSPNDIKQESYVVCQFRNNYNVHMSFKKNKTPYKYIYLKNSNPIEIK